MTGTLISRAWCVPTISIAGSSSSTATLSEIFSAYMCRPSDVGGALYVARQVHDLAIAGWALAIACILPNTPARFGYVDGADRCDLRRGPRAVARSARGRLRLKRLTGMDGSARS